MTHRAESGELGLILTIPLFNEVAGMRRRKEARLRQVAETLWDLGGAFMLHAPEHRIRGEVAARRKLEPQEAFYPAGDLERAREAFLNDQSFVEDEDEHAYRGKQRFKEDEERRREEVLALYRPAVDGLIGPWKRGGAHERHEIVDDWALSAMRKHREEYGLPADESTWARPR